MAVKVEPFLDGSKQAPGFPVQGLRFRAMHEARISRRILPPAQLVNPAPSELPGLEVSVDDVMYMPSLDAPADRPFPFVYFITIRNLSKITVTVKARKWVVKQRNGEIMVVEGDGVVGQFPRLEPGGEFTYNSCHTISQDSEATGAYFAEGEDARQYFVRIPLFLMELPQWV